MTDKTNLMDDPLEVLKAETARKELSDYISKNIMTLGPAAILYAMVHNMAALQYLNEGCQRGPARDKMSALIDIAFDTIQSPMDRAYAAAKHIGPVTRRGYSESEAEQNRVLDEVAAALQTVKIDGR